MFGIRNCAHCQTAFEATRRVSQYCSRQCKKAAYKARNRNANYKPRAERIGPGPSRDVVAYMRGQIDAYKAVGMPDKAAEAQRDLVNMFQLGIKLNFRFELPTERRVRL